MSRFKIPKEATEPSERYEAVVNYMLGLANNNPSLLMKLTKKEAKRLDTAVKNIRRLAALAKSQGHTDKYYLNKKVSLLIGFPWSENCANGGGYWAEINIVLMKLVK